MIAPDGTVAACYAGVPSHLTSFNYKDVKGTWILRIAGGGSKKGAITAWSLKVLGATSGGAAQGAAVAAAETLAPVPAVPADEATLTTALLTTTTAPLLSMVAKPVPSSEATPTVAVEEPHPLDVLFSTPARHRAAIDLFFSQDEVPWSDLEADTEMVLL